MKSFHKCDARRLRVKDRSAQSVTELVCYLIKFVINLGRLRNLSLVELLLELGSVIVHIEDGYYDASCRRQPRRSIIRQHHLNMWIDTQREKDVYKINAKKVPRVLMVTKCCCYCRRHTEVHMQRTNHPATTKFHVEM